MSASSSIFLNRLRKKYLSAGGMGDYRLDFNPKVYKNQSCQPVDLGEDVVELLRLEELPWDSAGVGTEAVDAVVVVAALGTGRQAGTQEGGCGQGHDCRHRGRGVLPHGNGIGATAAQWHRRPTTPRNIIHKN